MKKLDKKSLIVAILDAGLELWKLGGVRNVTHRAIAASVGRNPSGVLYHFDYKMETLRDAIAEHAVSTKCIPVILQLIASNHSATGCLTQEERAGYVAALANASTV